MSESTIKMIGLAVMILSVFAILFGAHAGEAGAPEAWGVVLVITGILLLLAGTIFYVVMKKD